MSIRDYVGTPPMLVPRHLRMVRIKHSFTSAKDPKGFLHRHGVLKLPAKLPLLDACFDARSKASLWEQGLAVGISP